MSSATAILFYLDKDELLLVGRPSIHNWVQYHAEKDKYNVSLSRDERSIARDVPIVRRLYRYQIQGPKAADVIQKLNGAPIPDIKFFNLGEITIAGRKVALCDTAWPESPVWRSGVLMRNARNSSGYRRRRRRIRASTGRVPRLCDQHSGIRMDTVSNARRLLGREDEGVQTMAPWRRLRSDCVAGRQLLFGQRRRLLPHAVGSGLLDSW
jgi:hypothetical protein